MMKELVQSFLLQLQNKNFSPHTLKSYREDLESFLDYATPRKWTQASAFTLAAVRSFLASLSAKNPARNTMLRKIAALRSFAKYLLEQGKIEQKIGRAHV